MKIVMIAMIIIGMAIITMIIICRVGTWLTNMILMIIMTIKADHYDDHYM